MKYTDEDLKRARVFLNHYSPDDTDVAQLIADVRAETRREIAARLIKIGEELYGHRLALPPDAVLTRNRMFDLIVELQGET